MATALNRAKPFGHPTQLFYNGSLLVFVYGFLYSTRVLQRFRLVRETSPKTYAIE